MKALPIFLLALSITAAHATAPDAQEESCDQIRAEIRAHTGIPTKPNTILLAGVGLWAGLAQGAGWLLQDALRVAITALERHAGRSLILLLVTLAVWLGWKLW